MTARRREGRARSLSLIHIYGAWVLTLMPKANREFADQGFRSTVKGILEQRIATLTAATKGMTDEQAVRYYHDLSLIHIWPHRL